MAKIPDMVQAGEIAAAHLGGRVVHIERQARWRPTWFIDLDRDGEVVPVVLRGDRPDSEAFPLRHEYLFHQMLEEREVPVPHLYGYLETPGLIDAVLMHRVPGQAGNDGGEP